MSFSAHYVFDGHNGTLKYYVEKSLYFNRGIYGLVNNACLSRLVLCWPTVSIFVVMKF